MSTKATRHRGSDAVLLSGHGKGALQRPFAAERARNGAPFVRAATVAP